MQLSSLHSGSDERLRHRFHLRLLLFCRRRWRHAVGSVQLTADTSTDVCANTDANNYFQDMFVLFLFICLFVCLSEITRKLTFSFTAQPTPPTPRPTGVDINGNKCGTGLLDCQCQDGNKCDEPFTCVLDDSTTATKLTTTKARKKRDVAAGVPRCKCNVGSRGCPCDKDGECIPGLLCDSMMICRTGT